MDIETVFWRAALFWAALGVIGTVISIWITYAVLKAAIRDGIRESGLLESLVQRRVETAHVPEARPER